MLLSLKEKKTEQENKSNFGYRCRNPYFKIRITEERSVDAFMYLYIIQ